MQRDPGGSLVFDTFWEKPFRLAAAAVSPLCALTETHQTMEALAIKLRVPARSPYAGLRFLHTLMA